MKTTTLLATLALVLAGCATTDQHEKLAFDTYAQHLRSGLMEQMEQATGKTWKDWTVEQRSLVTSLYLEGLKDYAQKREQELNDRLAAYNGTRTSPPTTDYTTSTLNLSTPRPYGATTFVPNGMGGGTISYPDGTHASVITNTATGAVSIQQY